MKTAELAGVWELVRAESGGEPSSDLLALRVELHLTADTYPGCITSFSIWRIRFLPRRSRPDSPDPVGARVHSSHD